MKSLRIFGILILAIYLVMSSLPSTTDAQNKNIMPVSIVNTPVPVTLSDPSREYITMWVLLDDSNWMASGQVQLTKPALIESVAGICNGGGSASMELSTSAPASSAIVTTEIGQVFVPGPLILDFLIRPEESLFVPQVNAPVCAPTASAPCGFWYHVWREGEIIGTICKVTILVRYTQ